MSRKIKVELTASQIDALTQACVDADGNDMDATPGDGRLAQAAVRERALDALLRAKREQT